MGYQVNLYQNSHNILQTKTLNPMLEECVSTSICICASIYSPAPTDTHTHIYTDTVMCSLPELSGLFLAKAYLCTKRSLTM